MKTKKDLALHEAMGVVVDRLGNVTVPQMTWVLNRSRLYVKKDRSEIKPCQIHARVSKYPDLFYIKDDCVYRTEKIGC